MSGLLAWLVAVVLMAMFVGAFCLLMYGVGIWRPDRRPVGESLQRASLLTDTSCYKPPPWGTSPAASPFGQQPQRASSLMEPSNSQILEALQRVESKLDALIDALGEEDEEDAEVTDLEGKTTSRPRDESQPL